MSAHGGGTAHSAGDTAKSQTPANNRSTSGTLTSNFPPQQRPIGSNAFSTLDSEASKKYVIVRKRKSFWPLATVIMRLFQLAFSVIVLALTVAYLFTPADNNTGSPAKCVYYLQLSYPSENPPMVNNLALPNGSYTACVYPITVAALGIFFSIIAVIDLLLVMMEFYVQERSDASYLLGVFVTLGMSILWTSGAIYISLGYMSTCHNQTCEQAGNGGVFPQKSPALAVLVFLWLSIVPWGVDAGFLIKMFYKKAVKGLEHYEVVMIEPFTETDKKNGGVQPTTSDHHHHKTNGPPNGQNSGTAQSRTSGGK